MSPPTACAVRSVICLLLAAGAATGTATHGWSQTAIVGGTVIRGDGSAPIENATVVVQGGRLVCVGPPDQCPVPAGAAEVDATGRFVTPGLVDAHVHFSQTGWIDGRPDGLSAPELYPYLETSRTLEADPGRWHRSYLCTGITAVFDVGGHPWTTKLPAAAEESPDAAHVRAAGPLITHATRTALMADDEYYTFLPMDTPEEVRSSVAKLVDMGSSAVKVWYLRPGADRQVELDQRLMEVGQAAREAGLDLIVHATSLREAKTALRAGAKLLVHSVQDEFVDDEFLALLRGNDGTYAPTLVVGANWTRAVAAFTLDLPPAPDDPGGCVDPGTLDKLADTGKLQALLPQARRDPEGIYRRLERGGASAAVMAENIRRVHESGARVATATDAGNPMTLHGPSIYNEMEAMQSAGIPAHDIVVMSTRNGAIAMNRLEDFGTLDPGKIADLLILEEDPTADVAAFRSLTHVMRAGVLRAQEELAWRRPAS
ncbi:MAG: amidohydrolase family protein [Gemmatimonadota bacterium]|nr:amidohydrolase family protein [Gemmatimonadota bacterium]